VQVENEVRPFMRCLQKFGRTTKKPSRAIWLERSAAFLSRFRDKSWKVIQGVKERSPGLLESRRVTPEMPGPER
jgi:hypothetical protein